MPVSNNRQMIETILTKSLNIASILDSSTQSNVLYENIDQTLLNTFHGSMHCEKGVTCVYKLCTCVPILCCNNMAV